MTQTEWIHLGVALALAVIAMLLVASEAAMAVMSRPRAAGLVAAHVRGADKVADIAADRAPFINTSMLVRLVCQVLVTLLVAGVVFDHLDVLWQRLSVTGAVMVLVWFIAWGVGPATLGRQHADTVALRSAGVLGGLTTVLGPVAQLLILIGNAVTPGKGYAEGPFSSEAELREMVDMAEASSVIEEGEADMIHSVFELGDTLAREVMVPRTDVVYIQAGKTLRQGLSLALRSGFSRIPVVGENLDDVQGLLYLKDVQGRIFAAPGSEQRETVGMLARPAVFVPDSKPVDELLHDMQRRRSHLVMVVDEFGGTAGLVTIEDILEEIVGEITDEYDAEPVGAAALDDGGTEGYRVGARMPLDELGDLFDEELDEDDVETVAGLMAKQLAMVPIPGSTVDWQGLRFTAEDSAGRRHRIETITVRRLSPEDEDTDDDAAQ
ncbi:MAG: hemolysin family protein [Actinomycetia bacterium]|nr:hemolysin family protein [Actinomycetes bacterium]